MAEILFDKAVQELNISKEKGMELAMQVRDFVELQNQRWQRGYKDADHELGGIKGYYDPEIKFLTPVELPNKGVGETFIVVWNSGAGSTTGGKRDPMEIWLATGQELASSKGVEVLSVNYFEVGKLNAGGRDIKLNKHLFLGKMGMYSDSPVILSPDSFK
jgi:hypothetical protein